jgi:hypothetical protein
MDTDSWEYSLTDLLRSERLNFETIWGLLRVTGLYEPDEVTNDKTRRLKQSVRLPRSDILHN